MNFLFKKFMYNVQANHSLSAQWPRNKFLPLCPTLHSSDHQCQEFFSPTETPPKQFWTFQPSNSYTSGRPKSFPRMTKLSPFPHSLCSAHAQFAPTLTQHYNLIHRPSVLLQARTSSIFMVQSTLSTLLPHTCPDLPLLIAHFLPNTLSLIYICHHGLKLPIQARAMSFASVRVCVCVCALVYVCGEYCTLITVPASFRSDAWEEALIKWWGKQALWWTWMAAQHKLEGRED